MKKMSGFGIAMVAIIGVALFALIMSGVKNNREPEYRPSQTDAAGEKRQESTPPPSDAPAQTSEVTDAPEIHYEETPIPVDQTAAPAQQTAAPAAPAAPTQEPTPKPTDVIPDVTPAPVTESVTADGSFSSNTGTDLNLVIEWSRQAGGSVVFNVYLDTYSLDISRRENGLTFTVGGVTRMYSTDAVNYTGGDKRKLLICSFTADVPAGEASVIATWDYRGSYSGTDLPVIVASGTIQ